MQNIGAEKSWTFETDVIWRGKKCIIENLITVTCIHSGKSKNKGKDGTTCTVINQQ